jgi:hypothetical protein
MTLRPGRSTYHCRFFRAQASFGELQLRVHGFYPGFDAQLVASAKIYLEEIERDILSLDVSFVALEGVQYALCGYVNDHTDMSVEAMDVHIEELGELAGGLSQSRRTSLVGSMMKHEAVAKLQGWDAPLARLPVCQPFTPGQLAEANYASLWPEIPAMSDDGRSRWAQVVALQALDQAGMLTIGAQALLIEPVPASLAGALRASGCSTSCIADLVAPTEPENNGRDTDATDTDGRKLHETDIIISLSPTRDYEQVIDKSLERLAIGGLGLLMFAVTADMSFVSWKNRLSQIALRLIGRGHQVVQFNFAAKELWWPEPGSDGLFLFMVRK